MLTNLLRSIVALIMLIISISGGSATAQRFGVEFYEGVFNFELDSSLNVCFDELTPRSVNEFYQAMDKGNYQPLVDKLVAYKNEQQMNDWIYYQLIRKTAQQISPKSENYNRYTLYKWFLLAKSGYDARLGISDDRLIFYVRNNENINDIPFFMEDGHKYMCLNIHDYNKLDLTTTAMIPIGITPGASKNQFSYKVTRMPDFKPATYLEKGIEFEYKHKPYYFQIKLNPEVERIFANYPGVDFESYFNIPLSKETYGSLIPILKKNTKGMSQKKGIDYLMRFTRYAFLYQNDDDNFGKEKRLSAEQTLFSQYSDCDDRAALFFYLVREIYDLPMIALLYPTHIAMAVRFDKPVGDVISYNGEKYSVCEATPQEEDLRIGQIASSLKKESYNVVYHYTPGAK